jgi:DNA polymerase-1
MALIFDLESDGLLPTLTKIHVLCVTDTESPEPPAVFRGQDIINGVKLLQEADLIVGQNIIGFDIPALQKVYTWFSPKGTIRDTLVLSRLIHTNLKDIDAALMKRTRPIILGKLFGSHGLEAWGKRLGNHKGDYKDAFKLRLGDAYEEGMEWLQWSQDMEDYCVQDVQVTTELWTRLLAHNYSEKSIQLEHEVATIINRQVMHGFCFNEKEAAILYGELSAQREVLFHQLIAVFGSWYVSDKDRLPKVDSKARGETKGVPFTKVKLVEFNPTSRQQIASRLTKLYGWEPLEFTASGQPQVDDAVIGKLPYPTAPLLTEYLLIDKRIGILAEGKQAWLKLVKQGRIHGGCNTNGAVTGRATHSHPNIAQAPKVNKKVVGSERYRALFGVPKGKRLVGADLSGLELRCLAHYMAKWDGGAYADAVLAGDIHTVNMIAAGLPTRDNAKTFIYGFLYGAGDAKIGSIVGGDADIGSSLKAKFLKGLPALANLSKAIKTTLNPPPKFDATLGRVAKQKQRKYLVGLDGRRIHIRSAHAALNSLLQSAGAMIAKQAIVILDKLIEDAGYQQRAHLVAWIHDEVQLECDEEIANEVGEMCLRSFKEAGEHFNFRVRIDGEYKVGLTWADTH